MIYRSLSPIIYTHEGESISEQLWKETMNELSFMKAEDVVKEISNLAAKS